VTGFEHLGGGKNSRINYMWCWSFSEGSLLESIKSLQSIGLNHFLVQKVQFHFLSVIFLSS